MDIAEAIPEVKEGDVILTYVKAILGTTNSVDSAVVYQADPAVTVSYTCRGATLTFHCDLNGEDTVDLTDEERTDAANYAKIISSLFQ